MAGNLGGVGRLQSKIDMPKAFSGAKLNGMEVELRILLRNLYFAMLDVLELQRAMRAALNLSEEAAV